MDNCTFCKIRDKEIPTEILYESDNVMAFSDINPSADVHILVVPKEHIPTFLDIAQNNKELLFEMVKVAQQIIKEKNLQDAYRTTFNGGRFQHVPHVHLHVLGGDFKKEV